MIRSVMLRLCRIALLGLCLAPAALLARAQAVSVPLTPDRWLATDSLRFETYLGRPSLYIDRGVALARDVVFQDGTLEYDIAATERTSFLGVVFHARALNQSEVVFFRPGDTGTAEAVQYGPAFNGIVAAWQVYHGPGANAVADVPRQRWVHVRLEIAGGTATLYFGAETTPTLVVPHLAGTGGTLVGVWAGAYGRGAYFSNIRYTPRTPVPVPEPTFPDGAITDWELSPAFDADTFDPERLPDLSALTWQRVAPEAPGFVLVNRYREAGTAALPRDPTTRRVLVDSVMTGRIAGARVVYARTTIDAGRDMFRRMHYGYSDGIVIYVNGQPLVFAMNPQFFRGQGIMEIKGDAVYLPLQQGRNEVVFAIPELTGGWAFWARLDAEPARRR